MTVPSLCQISSRALTKWGIFCIVPNIHLNVCFNMHDGFGKHVIYLVGFWPTHKKTLKVLSLDNSTYFPKPILYFLYMCPVKYIYIFNAGQNPTNYIWQVFQNHIKSKSSEIVFFLGLFFCHEQHGQVQSEFHIMLSEGVVFRINCLC